VIAQCNSAAGAPAKLGIRPVAPGKRATRSRSSSPQTRSRTACLARAASSRLAADAPLTAALLAGGADQAVDELLGQAVAGGLGDPNYPDVGPAPERIGEPVAGLVNGGHHSHIPPQQFHDRRAEGDRGKLHLAQLVDDHHPAGPGVAQRRQRDPLEGRQVHTVSAHPRRTRKIDVGQNLPGSGDGLDHEAFPVPPGPQLARGEPGDRHTRLSQ
jgi:hypothetical protein